MGARFRRRISRGLFVLLTCMAAAGLCFCLSQLVPKLLEYKDSDDLFLAMERDTISDYDPADRLYDADEDAVDTTDAVTVDWDAYEGTEIVAWFQMDDHSGPILQHGDNSYYLDHLPDGSYNAGGSLFLLNHNSPLFTDKSSFIYGHNMDNGSMFGFLKYYTGPEMKDHVFYLYLPDGTRHVYQFFSVATVFQESKTYTWSFESNKTFLEWQDWMLGESMVGTSLAKSEDARFVTLSTCNGYAGTNHRLVVCGQEVRVDKLQAPASWYGAYAARYEQAVSDRQAHQREVLSGLLAVQEERRNALYSEMYDNE